MAKKKKRPPYISGPDINALFERIRTMQAPKKVDTDWVETYKLAPNQPQGVPSLLWWLGIVDEDGAVSAEKWDSVRLPQSRPQALEPLVRDAYSDIFDRIDVEHATQDDLSGAFINAYGMGDPRRQIRCFLVLCALAGIPTAVDASRRPGPEPGTTKPISNGRTTPQTATRKKDKQTGSVKLPSVGAGVLVALTVEIPAEWNEDQIRKRLVTVARVLGEAGLGAT
jgi:hypothetical protein